YRQSKYESVDYDEPSRIGFNVQMDELKKKVLETQDMLDLTGLPAIEDSGDYGKSGYTTRNTAWDNYLELAEKLLAEMKADGVLK
ncbi:FMN-binding protein, partial [Clostridium perfringens]|nr:FMN-binding protein [Clostridium perfringens]